MVRELTIAAGIPMPAVYIIPDDAMNAFATGRDPEHASIAITTGLLTRMDREELQGVIGHELSHVRNYDIRFSLLVGVMVGSVALLSSFFLRFTFWFGGGRRSSDDRGRRCAPARSSSCVAIILAILAPIATRLVQLAVSRQREYMADASSVELTRNPHGLERALAQIWPATRRPEGGQPGHPAPVLPQPDDEAERESKQPVLDPPADRRADQPPAPADRRGAPPARRGELDRRGR